MKKLVFVLMVLLFFGCSAPVTHISSESPESHQIPEKRTFLFKQSKQATWDNLLSLFANSEFNIEKLNINAYQVKVRITGQPDLYVDCGKKKINTDGTKITIINAKRNYSYTAYQHIHLETYTYSNNFIGYAKIIVTGDDTMSKATVQYELEILIEEDKISTRGRNFSSSQHEKLQLSPQKAINSSLFNNACRSTGYMEQKIIEIMALMPDSASSTNKETRAKAKSW